MLPWKKILCPTDFSEPALAALRAAGELAQHHSAELILLHALTPIPRLPTPMMSKSFDVGAYFKELEQNGTRALEELARAELPAGLAVHKVVVSGDAASEILRVAGDLAADLILIATHGRTGWRHLITGSVAEKVVRSSPCPVLTLQVRPT